jgi:hypothetical protein
MVLHGNTGPTDKGADFPPARTPRPRSIGGALPRRLSPLRNVATPMKSGRTPGSRPRGRPNPSAGTGWSKKRTPPAERQGEDITRWIGSSDPYRKVADVDRVSHPKDVATVANLRKSWMRAPGSANGPKRPTDWNAVNLRTVQRVVRNLRQRIFRATQGICLAAFVACLSRVRGQLARTVLRGGKGREALPLPDKRRTSRCSGPAAPPPGGQAPARTARPATGLPGSAAREIPVGERPRRVKQAIATTRRVAQPQRSCPAEASGHGPAGHWRSLRHSRRTFRGDRPLEVTPDGPRVILRPELSGEVVALFLPQALHEDRQ